MDIRNVMRAGIAFAAFVAGGAFAQSKTPVMTDVMMAPAEERSSIGAVMIETDMVIAQREAFGARYTPAYVAAIGRDVLRATRAQQLKEELAQRKESEALRLHELGGPGVLTPR
jgi:membrane protein involved in colicin uptake